MISPPAAGTPLTVIAVSNILGDIFDGRARLTFTSGGGQVVMVFGRAELHRMLQMLATRAQASDRGLQAPWGE